MSCTNLTFAKGTDQTLTITVTDSNGVAVNITGYTFWFTAKKAISDTDTQAIIQKKVTILSDPLHGITVINLTNTDTDIPIGSYFYDIQQKDNTGKISLIISRSILNIVDKVTLSKT